MFKVKDKYSGEILTVYGIAGTMFLLWKYGGWRYEPMEDFSPVEDDE